jgi:hypothetical protein
VVAFSLLRRGTEVGLPKVVPTCDDDDDDDVGREAVVRGELFLLMGDTAFLVLGGGDFLL